METKFRGSLEGKVRARAGIVNNLGSIFRRIVHLETFPNSVPVDMFTASCLPYEASRTYRAIMTEFECKRSSALVEARRQNIRGL